MVLVGDWRLEGRPSGDIAPGSPVVAVLRYEKLVVSRDSKDGMSAVVTDATYLGASIRVGVRLGSGRSLIAELASTEANAALKPGSEVCVSWAPENLVVLPA